MRPHVAILPSPGIGHITPLLELAKRLVVHHGFYVSFLVITTEASIAQTKLLDSPTLPPDLHVINLPSVDVSAVIRDDMLVVTRLSVIVRETLKPLKSVLVEQLNRPKALVIDMFCTDAMDICKQLSISVYSYFTASTALLAFSLYLPTLHNEVECEYVDLLEAVQVPGCNPIRIEDLLDQVRNRKIDEYQWYFLHVSRLLNADGILVNTWEELEPVSLGALRENPFFKQILTPPIHSIGPLIQEAMDDANAETTCLAWLDKQPSESVLFISLGSGGTLTAEQFTELAWGLELSQQRFMWVVRKPSDTSASAAFFNVGSDHMNDVTSYLPEGFMRRTKEVGLVVPSWAPQVSVLRHSSTGGFLSHCGWNSTLESIVHGVPIITWPLYAEQRMNATILAEDIRVGVRPMFQSGKRVVSREEIERVIRLVMEGEEGKMMKQKAKELKDSALKSLDCGGSSYNSLANVVAEVRASMSN